MSCQEQVSHLLPGGLEDAMAKQWLRKVWKPGLGAGEGFLTWPGCLSCVLFGKTSEKALALEAVNTLAVLLSFACFARPAFPLPYVLCCFFLALVLTPGVSCFSCPALSSRAGHRE